MKNIFLLLVVSALLVTLGFAQTPPVSGSTDQATVSGCVGGTEGNYTVTEDGSGLVLNLTTSSVDLKPHVGHEVKLKGQKTTGAVGSAAANGFAVTELAMISEQCAGAPAAAAAAPVVSATPPSEIAPPPAAAAAPASPSSATVSTPAVDAPVSTPAVSPSPATVAAPPVEAPASAATAVPVVAVPVVTVTPPVEIVSAPAAKTAQPTRPSAQPRRPSAKPAPAPEPAVTVSPSADTATPVAAADAPAATPSPSADPVSTPGAAATAPTATHWGALGLMILAIALVVALGTLAPLFFRWRKRKTLERTGTPNLSLTNEVSSYQEKPEPRKAA